MKIAIIGLGFVGGTIYKAFKNKVEIETYDKYVDCTLNSIKDITADIIFVAVPTPMEPNGACHIGILEDVLSQIKKGTVIIKSTVPPGTTLTFQQQFKNLDIVFNPEFLTEKNAFNDFMQQSDIYLSGDPDILCRVVNYYQIILPKAIYYCKKNHTELELFKYTINAFLATKVSFFNEIKQLCDELNIPYDNIKDMVWNDRRIGISHTNVPGHDGKLGFGGSCFPKDMSGLISVFKYYNLNCNTIEGAWKTNKNVRDHDWEKLKGRAIL